MFKFIQNKIRFFPSGVANKFLADFNCYLTLTVENLTDNSIIEIKQSYVRLIVDFLHLNPLQAGEVVRDLPRDLAHNVRYTLLHEFEADCEEKGIDCGYLKSEQIPAEIGAVLHCWCCNKQLNDCLMLSEEGWTTLKHESDPYIFDRARANGMTYIDGEGRERIYSCGYSYS